MMQLTSLGRLDLIVEGASLLQGRRKLLSVLVYLARARGPVSRAQLAELFWPVEDEVRARRSVRQALTELRRAVGPALQDQHDTVGIAVGSLELDASLLEAAVSRGQYQRAVDLWGGEFLAGLEEVAGENLCAWLETERQGLRKWFAFAAEALATEAERRGAWVAGLAVTARWCETLRYDERAHLRHARLLVLAGRLAEAGAWRVAFSERLRREMGLEPSAEFQHLAAAQEESSAGRSGTPGGRALLSPDLIGREAAFDVLTRAWESVQRGAPGLVLIEGEEGLGKSRLIEEFLRWVVQHQPRTVVLRARAFEAERDRSWGLARHLLRSLTAAPGVTAAPAGALKALAALVPEMAERFPGLPAEIPIAPLSDAVVRVLADVAAESPVVVAVDDADLADPESLELLEGLCRRPVAGVLVLLSALPEQLQALADLERRGETAEALARVRLDPLTAGEVERVIAGMAEFGPGDRRVLAGRLHVESGGNPLAVVELLATLAAQGTITPGPDGRWAIRALGEAPLPLPSSLREAMLARLGQLSPDAIRVLGAAAVLGREAEVDLLRDLTGLDPVPFDAAVDEAVEHRLLRVVADGLAGLEFAHEAGRRAVYEGLPPLRRRELHRRVYRILRRRPARDSTRQAALEHHRSRAGETPVWRWTRRWVLAAGAVALGIGGLRLLQRRAPSSASPTVIAVLPFEVREGAQYSYLGEGMVDLLSADLDGLGGLRSIDPRALLTLVSRDSTSVRDPTRGRSVAARMGAGLYVLGDIVEAGGRVQVAAYLYDAQGRLQTVARASADSEADIHRAVDEIARQLLAGRRKGPAEGLTRLAVATTASVPALKAYLEGERRLREGAFGPAVEAFQSAIAADTTFALAYYRLAVAAEWDARSALSERAAEQAARLGGRLSGHHAWLVEALLAWRRGDASTAEYHYRAVAGHYPDDLEGWFQLGEVLFHANPLRGRSIAEAREAWERVLALEPGNRFAVLHLARIAASQEDTTRLVALVKPISNLEPNGDRRELELAGWRALVLHARSEEDRVSEVLRRSNGLTQQNVIWQLATWSRDLAGSERLGRLLLEFDRHDVSGHLILAHLDLARGMRRRTEAQLQTGARSYDGITLTFRAYFASLPFVSLREAQLVQLRDELTAWHPRATPVDPEGASVQSLLGAAAPLLRDYLLGTVSVRLGDLAGAAQRAASLERAQAATPADSLAQALALGVRALVARSQGDPVAALRLLERIQRPARREEVSQSPFHAVALERYLRAELLRELGRDDEALAWHASLGELSPFELIFLGPSHLHQAEIYERLGRRTEAIEHYVRFIDLWHEADPEFQPAVAAARARLEELRR